MLSSQPAVPLPGQKPITTASLSSSVMSPSSAVSAPGRRYNHHHIWLVTGPAGCGKTSVAEHLASALGMPYIEGDSFHTPANVAKMSNGIPLTDADRWDWLTILREESMNKIHAGADGVVLTCSALKRKYRDVIRVAGYYDPHVQIHFIYLDAKEEVIVQRVAARQNHYMGAEMVRSQFAALEVPAADEKDVISVDVSSTLDEVKVATTSRVLSVLESDVRQDRQG